MADNNDNKSKLASWLDSTTAKVAGVVFAVAATAITARDAISRGFFKTVNKGKDGAFVDIQEIRDTKIAAVTAQTKGKRPVAVADAPAEIHKINKEYEAAYKTRRKLLNFNNVFDEWKALKTHQRLEVAFASAAVASVAIGAIMAIASSRSKVQALEDHIEQTEPQQPQR